MPDPVLARLNSWRRSLIDLTGRNPLLNFRPTRASTVEIVDELPTQILKQLLAGESFRFDPTPEDDGEIGFDSTLGGPQPRPEPGQDLLELLGGEIQDRHRDDRLQTNLTRKRLGSNLLKIYRRFEESLEEKGINTLFLALGMLQWYEDENSNMARRAPIVMVPVKLVRKNAASDYKLSLGDDDPIINPALVEKLRLDFRIILPELPELTEDLDVDGVFRDIDSKISGLSRWSITSDVALGLFSFQKFIMYRDIELHQDHFLHNGLIRSLSLADQHGESILSGLPQEIAEADLDEEMSPWVSIQVLDADSSQQRAILAARKGHDLVIEGPPGTGKSQTITNLIADALHAGKTVLFVSAKMAALEVVKTRLEHEAGLGDFVLELYSSKRSKTEFVKEICRSLDRVSSETSSDGQTLEKLRRVTGDLRSYVVELHEPMMPLGMSPFQAIGILASMEDEPRISAQIPDPMSVSGEKFRAAKSRLVELGRCIDEIGPPADHPLHGVGLELGSRSERETLDEHLNRCQEGLEEFCTATSELVDELGFKKPETIGETQVILDGARVMTRSPGAETSVLENPQWNELSSSARDLLEVGKRYRRHRLDVNERCYPDVFDTDHGEDLARFSKILESGVWRVFRPGYWRTRMRLRKYLREGIPAVDDKALRTLFDDIQRCRDDADVIRASHDLGISLFGRRWQETESNWSELEEFADWVVEFRQYALKEILDNHGLQAASRGHMDTARTEAMIQRVERAFHSLRKSLDELVTFAGLDAESGISSSPATCLEHLSGRLGSMSENTDKLRAYSAYVAARRACPEDLTGPYIESALRQGVGPGHLAPAFVKLFMQKLLDRVLQDRPALAGFRSRKHEDTIAAFQGLDRQSLELAKERTRCAIESRRSDLLNGDIRGQLTLLQREARKRRRILPIRKLLQQAPQAIQLIRPCMMMSPLSVAQFLDPERIHFDMIVFDEASQIPPYDAIGSVIRADQVVVTGDSKQLPPTNFFGMIIDEDNEDQDEGLTRLEDLESILDEVATCGTPSVRLKWHYRSQHQSLIRFSNEEFYADDPLYVFPSINREGGGLGLQFEYVADGIYEGRGRNSNEARKVAAAVRDHIHSRPSLSLGVGTFGIGQQSVIQDELDKLRRRDPSIEWFFSQGGEQKFFVKNLENIQGEDRDIIFLSVTYGPDANGVLKRNFGPINKQDGWRRLNVITTRAKRQMRVFSSMRADQIDPRNLSRGGQLLRHFLKYAESGVYPTEQRGERDPDSPFEMAVMMALKQRGYYTVPQIGDAGYWIDIGIVDEDYPGRYICGIECDGASYHSAATVRDRDRLRQEVLEARGWDIHRVWSTDWFHDPDRQVDRLVELIEQSRLRANEPDDDDGQQPVEGDNVAEAEVDAPEHQTTDLGAGPGDSDVCDTDPILMTSRVYEMMPVSEQYAHEDFHAADLSQIGRVAVQVISIEGPIHLKELSRRTAGFWGLQKAGHRVVERVKKAVRKLDGAGDIEVDGPFYWSAHLSEIPVRKRVPGTSVFKAELIAPCEAEQAMRFVLYRKAPLLENDLIVETARELGFNRTGSHLRDLIVGAKDRLVVNGEIRPGGKGLYLVPTG